MQNRDSECVYHCAEVNKVCKHDKTKFMICAYEIIIERTCYKK